MDLNSAYLPTSFNNQKQAIRRSFNFELVSQDYFEVRNVPDSVIEHIFDCLSHVDLLNAMATCKKFYWIGKRSKCWKKIDLSNVTISEFALFKLLENCQTKMIKMTSSRLFRDNLSYLPSKMFDRLVYLDLSYVVYSDPLILSSILEKTHLLQYLNIARFESITDELCQSIGNNKHLKYLNLEMCRNFTDVGLTFIFESCEKLLELNLAWSVFSPNTLKVVCPKLPPHLQKLNFSGIGKLQLNDEVVESIVQRCTHLIEIDLSDCFITEQSLNSLKKLKQLKKMSLSRCHEVDPIHFVDLEGGLSHLNVYGCITNEGLEFLRNRLKPTTINESALSNIAILSFKNFT